MTEDETPKPLPEDHKGRPDGKIVADPKAAERERQERNLPTHDWPGKGAA